MKVIDLYTNYKCKYPDSIVIMQMGNFYEVIDQDSIIIHLLFDYKIKEFAGTMRVGFPLQCIDKVTSRLASVKVNYIVIDSKEGEKVVSSKKTFKGNQYDQYIEESNQIMEASKRIDTIHKMLKTQVRNTNILQILSKIERLI